MTQKCYACERPLDADIPPEKIRDTFAKYINDPDTDGEQGGEWSDYTKMDEGQTKFIRGFGEVKLVAYDTSNVITDSYCDMSGTSFLVLEVFGVLLRQDLEVDSYGGAEPRGATRIVTATPKTVTIISYE